MVNATTIATQVINEARTRHGDVDAVDLPRSLWEQVMDEVTAAGGDVGFDFCVVDGCAVRGTLPDHDRRAVVHLPGGQPPEHLPLAGDGSG